MQHSYKLIRHNSDNPIKAVKIWFYYHIVRRLKRPQDFWHFDTRDKDDYYLTGRHWSCDITYRKDFGETRKQWNAFCFKMVFESRNNKKACCN